jgi:hypothetical protein
MITNKVFDAITIGASGSAKSVPLDLQAYAEEGFFSLQIALTGDGTAKFEYEISNDGETFITQTATADQIVSGFTKTSGPGSDGKDLISFEPEPAKKMRIKCTETGTANSVTITVTIVIA